MNRQQIKLIAIAAMTIDHIAFIFLQADTALYFVMRIMKQTLLQYARPSHN